MGTYVISGSASGMGAATQTLLRQGGHRVIGIDVRDAEVIAAADEKGLAMVFTGMRHFRH